MKYDCLGSLRLCGLKAASSADWVQFGVDLMDVLNLRSLDLRKNKLSAAHFGGFLEALALNYSVQRIQMSLPDGVQLDTISTTF